MTSSAAEIAGTKRDNVESILPLLHQQQALLWAPNPTNSTLGVLTVQGALVGPLDHGAFNKAWNWACSRHEMLRASIHARRNEKPRLVVWRRLEAHADVIDLSDKPAAEQAAAIGDFVDSESRQGLPLDQAPVYRVHLLKIGPKRHELIWLVHHAFLDGWSSSLVIQDVLAAYHSLSTGCDLSPYASPSRFGEYLTWRNNRSRSTEESFWRTTLAGYQGLPNQYAPNGSKGDSQLAVGIVERQLDNQLVKRLQQLSRDTKTTPNTVAVAMWALTMSQIYGQDDVCLALVVSGRSAPISGMLNMVGPLANTVPLRCQISNEQTLASWLRDVCDSQFLMQPYEHASFAEIASCCSLDRARCITESLLVFENYPLSDRDYALRLENYRSGIVSGFPLTICILPDSQWTLKCLYNPVSITRIEATAMIDAYHQSLTQAVADTAATVGELRHRLPTFNLAKRETTATLSRTAQTDPGPCNDIEVQLLILWEQVLGKRSVGVRDSFFDLGGTSLSAVLLLARIEDCFEKRLSAAELWANPTVAECAALLKDHDDRQTSSMIRFNRQRGADPVVFVHAGGEPAFYFRHLAARLPDRPTVALQPRALLGGRPAASFTDLAVEYLAELQRDFGHCKIHLAGYCMGAPVALAMARQWKAAGGEVGALVIIDSGVKYRRRGTWSDFVTKYGWGIGLPGFCYHQCKRIYRWCSWHAKNIGLLLFDSAENRREISRRRVESACQKAFFSNQPLSVDVPIYLIRSSEHVASTAKDFHLDWRNLTSRGFFTRNVKGKHQSILLEPQVRHVAEIIADIIAD